MSTVVKKSLANLQTVPGASSTNLKVPSVIAASGTAGSNSGAASTLIYTSVIKAGMLQASGDFVRVTAFGASAANANNKTISVKVGTADIISWTNTYNNIQWRVEVTAIYRDATTLAVTGVLFPAVSGTPLLYTNRTVTVSSLTSDRNLELYLQGSSTTDITADGWLAEIGGP